MASTLACGFCGAELTVRRFSRLSRGFALRPPPSTVAAHSTVMAAADLGGAVGRRRWRSAAPLRCWSRGKSAEPYSRYDPLHAKHGPAAETYVPPATEARIRSLQQQIGKAHAAGKYDEARLAAAECRELARKATSDGCRRAPPRLRAAPSGGRLPAQVHPRLRAPRQPLCRRPKRAGSLPSGCLRRDGLGGGTSTQGVRNSYPCAAASSLREPPVHMCRYFAQMLAAGDKPQLRVCEQPLREYPSGTLIPGVCNLRPPPGSTSAASSRRTCSRPCARAAGRQPEAGASDTCRRLRSAVREIWEPSAPHASGRQPASHTRRPLSAGGILHTQAYAVRMKEGVVDAPTPLARRAPTLRASRAASSPAPHWAMQARAACYRPRGRRTVPIARPHPHFCRWPCARGGARQRRRRGTAGVGEP